MLFEWWVRILGMRWTMRLADGEKKAQKQTQAFNHVRAGWCKNLAGAFDRPAAGLVRNGDATSQGYFGEWASLPVT